MKCIIHATESFESGIDVTNQRGERCFEVQPVKGMRTGLEGCETKLGYRAHRHCAEEMNLSEFSMVDDREGLDPNWPGMRSNATISYGRKSTTLTSQIDPAKMLFPITQQR